MGLTCVIFFAWSLIVSVAVIGKVIIIIIIIIIIGITASMAPVPESLAWCVLLALPGNVTCGRCRGNLGRSWVPWFWGIA